MKTFIATLGALAALAVLAAAVPSSGVCAITNVCNTYTEDPINPFVNDCPIGGQCCNGVCVSSASTPGKGLGGTCTSNVCGGQCYTGGCVNDRCERLLTSSAGPGCECTSNANCYTGLCDYNVNRTASLNVCRWQSLPAGSACVIDEQCSGSSVCTNNKCTGSGASVSCSSNGQCDPPNLCVTQEVVGSTLTVCGSARAPPAYCQVDQDCASGLCDAFNHECVAPGSIEAGANCTAHAACESGRCGFGPAGKPIFPGMCIERPFTTGANQPCPLGNGMCATGVCAGSVDPVCKPTNGLQCSGSAECGDSSECKCTAGVNRCTPIVRDPTDCIVEKLQFQRFFGLSSGPSIDVPYHLYPTSWKAAAAKYFCCRAKKENEAVIIDGNKYQAWSDQSIDCSVDDPTFTALADVAGTIPTRCTQCDVVGNDNLVGVPTVTSALVNAVTAAQAGSIPSPAATLTPSSSLAALAALAASLAVLLL